MIKYLVIAVVLLVLILVSALFFWQKTNIEAPIASPSPIPSASVTVTPLSVKSVAPEQNATGVGLSVEIIVTFNRPLSNPEKDQVQLSLYPVAEGATFWLWNDDALRFTTSKPLTTNQTYSATVNYGDQKYNWSFKTAASDITSTAEQIEKQAPADKNFGDFEKNVSQKYPWLDKLPIKATNYYFYFDVNKEGFIGRLYPQKNSSLTIDQQVEQFKQEIMVKLTDLGIDIGSYKLEWEVIPE